MVGIIDRRGQSVCTRVDRSVRLTIVSEHNIEPLRGGCGRGRLSAAIVGLGQITEHNARRRFTDNQRAGGTADIIQIIDHGADLIGTGIDRHGRRVIEGPSHVEISRRGDHCGRLGRAVVGLAQVAEDNACLGFANSQRAARCPAIVQVVDRRRNLIRPRIDRCVVRTVITQGNTEAGWRGGRGGYFGRAIVGLAQISKHNLGRGLGNDQGLAGRTLVVRVVDACRYDIRTRIGRCGGRPVISERNIQARRICRDRSCLGSAIVGRRQIGQGHQHRGFTNDQRVAG